MNNKTPLIFLVILISLSSCSSSKLKNEWRRPNSAETTFSKVLVIGMSENIDVRTAFESDLVARLKKEGVEAERSIDAFDENYASLPKNETQLSALENELIREDFDAVIVTKIFNQEESETTTRRLRELTTLWSSLQENQVSEEHENDYQGVYEIYHIYSSLYCGIGDDNEWESIWRAYIEIKEPKRNLDVIIEDGVKKYNQTLMKALIKQNLLHVN